MFFSTGIFIALLVILTVNELFINGFKKVFTKKGFIGVIGAALILTFLIPIILQVLFVIAVISLIVYLVKRIK